MPRHIYRSLVARILVALLVSLGFVSFQASIASAAGTTPQTITVPPLPSVAQVNQSFSMGATASSGLPVSISVEGSPATACNALSLSFFSVDAIGTCTLTFDQPGDSTYAAAPTVTVTISVQGAQQVITPPPTMYIPVGSTGQIIASSSLGFPLQYAVASLGTPNCSVNSTGLVTGLTVGGCTVTLNSRGSATVAPAPTVNLSVWITRLIQTSLVLAAPTRLAPGDSATISVTGGSGTGAMTISATGDCSLSGATVTANSSGSTCTVTVTKAADAQYESITTSQVINIASVSSGGSSGGTNPNPGPVASTDSSGDITFVLDEEATKLLKPSMDATDVWSGMGGQLVFTGRNLLSIEQVFIADKLPVNIVKATDASMTIELPKASLLGWQSLTLLVSGGTKVFADAVRYLEPKPVVLKPVTKILKGFKANQKALTKAQGVALKKYVKSVGKYKVVECRGIKAYVYLTCKYLKKIYKAGRVKVSVIKVKATTAAAKQVRLVFTR